MIESRPHALSSFPAQWQFRPRSSQESTIVTEGTFAKTHWCGNLKMTKLNKISSPHVGATTHLLVNPSRHPPLSTHAVHQGRPITPHTSSDSRPSCLPIRPSSPTARATASARKGVGGNPRHPPAVPRQWPNDGGWRRRPRRRRRRCRHHVHDAPRHRRRRARRRVDGRAADEGHGSVDLCLHACGGGDGPGRARNGSRTERTRRDDGDPGRGRRCRRSGGRRGPNRRRRPHRRPHRRRRLRPAAPRAAGQHPPPPRGQLDLLLPPTGARCPSPHRRPAHTRQPQAAPDGAAAAQQRPLQAPLRPLAAAAGHGRTRPRAHKATGAQGHGRTLWPHPPVRHRCAGAPGCPCLLAVRCTYLIDIHNSRQQRVFPVSEATIQ